MGRTITEQTRLKRKRARQAPQSRRYTPEERADAIERILAGEKRDQIAARLGCTTEAIRRWYVSAKHEDRLPKPADTEANGVATEAKTKSGVGRTNGLARAEVVAAASSRAPKDPGAGLGEHETTAILDYKKKHPSMGPAQIRAQLKRFLGWRLSVKAIARVLKQAGFPPVHRGGRPVGDENPVRWEAPYRSALWQLDYTELRIGKERRYLLVVEDDFSRFVVGHCLAESPSSEVAVETMRAAMRLHGKPERVYTDRGAAFTAWRGIAAFESFLDEQLIDHSLRRAHRPQGGGKIEAVIGTVQRELWQVVQFDSVDAAEQALIRFFVEYNHRRAHLGIGGLVPADRFYGRWPEVQAEMEAHSRRRPGAIALAENRRLFVEPPEPEERVVVLQLVVADGQAELIVLGRRIRLGASS